MTVGGLVENQFVSFQVLLLGHALKIKAERENLLFKENYLHFTYKLVDFGGHMFCRKGSTKDKILQLSDLFPL